MKNFRIKFAISKSIVVLLLSLVFVFSLATFSACGNTSTNTGNNGNTSQDNNDNSNNSGNTSDGNLPSINADPLDSYSDIVKYVVNNSEMDNLLARAEVDKSLYDTPLFDPHPYTFLEEQGHDVEKVKSGDLSCRTTSYIDPDEPNNLYMMTYVENAADSKCTVNYYTEYLLKYTLTDQEITDYKTFHKTNAYSTWYYIQAVFLNEAISATKPVQIVNKQEMTVYAHNTMRSKEGDFDRLIFIYEDLDANFFDIMLKDFDEESQTFNIYVYEYMSGKNYMYDQINMCVLPLRRGNSKLNINDNNVFLGPATYGGYDLGKDLTSYKESIKKVSAYSGQDTNLNTTYCQDFKEKLNK